MGRLLSTVALCIVLVALPAAADNWRCANSGKDIWFGDISNSYVGSFQECKDKCNSIESCSAIVYYHWGVMTGKCFIKNEHHGAMIDTAWTTTAFKSCFGVEGDCKAGEYKSKDDLSECSPCPAGTFSKAGRPKSCTACPEGSTSAPGSASCTAVSKCAVGTYEVESGSCKACPANSYNDVAGAKECKPCGEGLVSSEGSSSKGDCKPEDKSHCWALHLNRKMSGLYGKAMGSDDASKADASKACMADANCTGVTCHKRKKQCYLAKGKVGNKPDRKWESNAKEC